MEKKRGHWTLLVIPAVTVVWLGILVAVALSIVGAANPEQRFVVFLVLVGFFSVYAIIVALVDKLRGNDET